MTPNLPAGSQPQQLLTSTSARQTRRRTAPAHRPLARASQAPTAGGGTPDAHVPERAVRVSSPTSLLAVVPGLLGFDPGDSIVVIGTEPPRGRVRVTLRYDLPDPRRRRAAAALAKHAMEVLGAQGISTAFAVGYGTDAAVSPVAAALRERATEAGITLMEVLRAQDARYWSYVCTDPGCCPPAGTPFDISDHPAARALTAAGGRVLGSRDQLAATLAAADGPLGETMRRATSDAIRQVDECVSRLERSGARVRKSRLTAALGLVSVSDAIRRYRADEPVGTDQAAWLTIALREVRVRDDAWARMDPEHQGAHLRLWSDLTRLALPGYVAAPASLLAFCAWQSGDGALANVALDRALADNPRYSMALLLRDALDSGAPPSMARLPMTPEEVAASYDALEGPDADDSAADSAAVGDAPEGKGASTTARRG